MLEDTLTILGYRPEDDSWETDGRVTYCHDDNASVAYVRFLRRILARQGWCKSSEAIRAFRHPETDHLIEIEPGGADCTGHYLHLMRA